MTRFLLDRIELKKRWEVHLKCNNGKASGVLILAVFVCFFSGLYAMALSCESKKRKSDYFQVVLALFSE